MPAETVTHTDVETLQQLNRDYITSVQTSDVRRFEEILAEVNDGNYDLLCMGSPYSSNALRQLYTPNVTAEIAEHDRVPVLTARYARPG